MSDSLLNILIGFVFGVQFWMFFSIVLFYVKQKTEIKLSVDENGNITNVYYKSNRLRKGDTYKVFKNDELISSGEIINHSAEWGELSVNNG